MEKFVNNLILEKVDEIVSTIKDSKEYQDYQFLKEKMSHNQNVMKFIDEIKVKQKELVRKKYYHEDTGSLEEELAILENQLKMIPLYCEFLDKQMELNEIFASTKEKIENFLDENIN